MASPATRLTKGDIHKRVGVISEHYGIELKVNFYSPAGRSLGRITNANDDNISDRLNLSDLALWLDGYEAALKQAKLDEDALLKAALLLADLAEGLDVNQKAGPIHPDFLTAAKIVRDYKR